MLSFLSARTLVLPRITHGDRFARACVLGGAGAILFELRHGSR